MELTRVFSGGNLLEVCVGRGVKAEDAIDIGGVEAVGDVEDLGHEFDAAALAEFEGAGEAEIDGGVAGFFEGVVAGVGGPIVEDGVAITVAAGGAAEAEAGLADDGGG